MIAASDIKFYRALNWGDNLLCGGPNTGIEIREDELTNLFTDVPGEYTYWGGYRYRKIFIGNSSTSEVFNSIYAMVVRDSNGDDTVSINNGTTDDLLKEAQLYTTDWYGVGTLSSDLLGRDTIPEGPISDCFIVTVIDSSTGFYSDTYVCISEGDMYEIAKINTVQWFSSTQVRLFLNHGLEHTFLSGRTEVSSMLFLGDLSAGTSSPVWIRQYIPIGADFQRSCRPKIRIVGV